MMKIQEHAFAGEGLTRVFENEKWMVGIKNWKPANDIANIDCLERHNGTDELFVLVEGSCTLLFANEVGGKLVMEAVKMQPHKVYNIPRSLWHNTVTAKTTKLILVEDSSTSSANSEVLALSDAQRAEARKLAL
jgi:ureidoglycolate hydrolase